MSKIKNVLKSKPHTHEFLGEDGPCLICGKTIFDLLKEAERKEQ